MMMLTVFRGFVLKRRAWAVVVLEIPQSAMAASTSAGLEALHCTTTVIRRVDDSDVQNHGK